MDKLLAFRKERERFERVNSLPIDLERSKFSFDANARELSGYPIIWNEKNAHGEIVLKGATANSLNARGVGAKKNPIVMLYQHDTRQVLMRPRELFEDDYGLFFRGDVVSNVGYADEALALIQQEVLQQLSYGFGYIWERTEYSDELDAIVLKELKLWEYSLVTFSSGDSAQLQRSSFQDYQIQTMLQTFNAEQIRTLSMLLSGAASSTPLSVKEEETAFSKLCKALAR